MARPSHRARWHVSGLLLQACRERAKAGRRASVAAVVSPMQLWLWQGIEVKAADKQKRKQEDSATDRSLSRPRDALSQKPSRDDDSISGL